MLDDLKEKIYQNNKYDYKIYQKVIKKYNYTIKNNYLDTCLDHVPYYFPANWIYDHEYISKNKDKLIQFNEKLKELVPCFLKKYLIEWLKLFDPDTIYEDTNPIDEFIKLRDKLNPDHKISFIIELTRF